MNFFQEGSLVVHKNKHKYPVSEVLDSYKNYVTTKKQTIKYTSYAKAFMLFCIENNLTVSKMAANQFLFARKTTSTSITSILNCFLKFCEINHIESFYEQTTFKGEHPFVLRFLSQYDFKNMRTKRNYQDNVNAFFRYLSENHKVFSYASLQDYLQNGLLQHLSVFTLNARLASIKSFIGWLIHQNDLLTEMSDYQIKDLANISNIKSFKIPAHTYHKDSLTVAQREELLSRVDDIKHKLAICFQVFEGLRASEVCAIRFKDIDIENDTILVKGKGRYVFDKIRLFGNTKKVLLEYLKGSMFGENDLLFGKMSYQNLYKIVDRAYLKPFAKEKKTKLSLHSLRHTAAQIMVEKGIDKDYIQKQLRHVDYQTTQIYMKKQIDKLFLEQIPKDL